VQTLMTSPHLEPVEYVISLTSTQEAEDSDGPPSNPGNAPSLQWSMSM